MRGINKMSRIKGDSFEDEEKVDAVTGRKHYRGSAKSKLNKKKLSSWEMDEIFAGIDDE